MPILPLDDPEPFAATLGVMLYPDADEAEQRKARAFAARWLAKPLQRFHQNGHKLSYADLAHIAEGAGESLDDIGKRIWGGTATGEMFKALFAIANTDPTLASWNNAARIAEIIAARRRTGARSAQWAARRRFLPVAHLWGAWSIREGRFGGCPDVGYDGWHDFQSFLAEAEILRHFGQEWRPQRAKSTSPLPLDVWRVPETWMPPERQPGWPDTGKIPLMSLPENLLRKLKPAGRPRKRA